ncbi:MAG: NifB/NifX family molybdenum-iron cluster-binding protein [Pseudomonadota bacterium]
MRIAIATDEDSVSAHFGRCMTYTIVDIENGKAINRLMVSNPEHSPGFLPGFLAQKGVNCVIAGGMGPRAQDLLSQNSIQTIIGVSGKVDDVIDRFIANALESGESTCDQGEHGHEGCDHHK